MRARGSYDNHAAGYQRSVDPSLGKIAARVVGLAAASPGVRLLDLATGTGAIAREAAARGASVVGVDASAGMIDAARVLAPGLDLRVAEAAALPFADATFDVVTCGLALSHFTPVERALSEVRRVLRPGGSLVASAWTTGTSTPFGPLGAILDRYTPPSESSVDEATWADAEHGSEVLQRAGFRTVAVHLERFTGAFPDAETALAWFVAWPETAARLEAAPVDAFRAEARDALAALGLDWRFAFNVYVART